jgi:putative oxidoreductase
MRKFLSINYSQAAFNIAMLILRVGAGAMAMSHGYSKLVHFAEMKSKFMNFMGIGSTLSLILVIFAEFFCSIFLIIGLFSRLVVIPLIIVMTVALLQRHNSDVFGEGEKVTLFLTCFLPILLCGPGKASVDGMMR